jgi:hypothetical protein
VIYYRQCNTMEVIPAIKGLSCFSVRHVKYVIQCDSPVGGYNCNTITWADACLYESICHVLNALSPIAAVRLVLDEGQ